jgi:hypothetical protein
VLAGAIAGGWLYRDVLSSYFPTDEMTRLNARVDTLEASTKTATEQLVTVSAAADHANQAAQTADASAKEVASSVATTTDSVSGLSTRLEKAEKALQSAKSDLDALRSAVAAGGTAGSGNVDPAALAAIGQRLDALEKDVASLKGGAGLGDQSASLAALSQALSDIKAKIAAGTAYRDDLDRIARMVPAAAGLDILKANAAAGLPAAKGLAAELRAAIPTLPKPNTSTPAESSGYLDSFWNAVTSIVTIRTIGEADWPAIAEQCASFAETGDLTQAIARIDASEGAIPPALSQWRDRASTRLKLEAALAEVSDAVQRQIVSLGAGQ